MSGSCEKRPPSEKPKRRRRWLQISVRSLLVIMTLAAVGAATWRWYEAPFRRQRQAMAAIEKAGGSYQTVAAGPAWLRRLLGEDRFQNITVVNVADCDDPNAYLDHVAALPVLETLVVGGPAFKDEHLRHLHGLATLRGLMLDCTDVTDEALAALCELMPGLETFHSQRRTNALVRQRGGRVYDTQQNFTHRGQLRALGPAWFEEAKRLELSPSFVDDDLALFKRFGQLQALRIASPQITDAGLAKLTPRLSELWLNDTQVSDAGLIHLKSHTELFWLNLGGTKITDAGMVHLATLSKLRFLYLYNTKIGDAGVAHLARLRQLEELGLSTQVTDEGLAHLKSLTQLHSLQLHFAPVGDAGLAHLVELKNLRALYLSGTRVTDAGLAHLRKLPNLDMLQLDRTKVGDTGLAHLVELKNLRRLRLGGTQVSDAALVHLKKLANLNELHVDKTKFTAKGVEDLREALPKCTIIASAAK